MGSQVFLFTVHNDLPLDTGNQIGLARTVLLLLLKSVMIGLTALIMVQNVWTYVLYNFYVSSYSTSNTKFPIIFYTALFLLWFKDGWNHN